MRGSRHARLLRAPTEAKCMSVNTEMHKLINNTKQKGSGTHVNSCIISINCAVCKDIVFVSLIFFFTRTIILRSETKSSQLHLDFFFFAGTRQEL